MVELSLCLTDFIHIPCFLYSTSILTKSELFIIGGRHIRRHELASTFFTLKILLKLKDNQRPMDGSHEGLGKPDIRT